MAHTFFYFLVFYLIQDSRIHVPTIATTLTNFSVSHEPIHGWQPLKAQLGELEQPELIPLKADDREICQNHTPISIGC